VQAAGENFVESFYAGGRLVMFVTHRVTWSLFFGNLLWLVRGNVDELNRLRYDRSRCAAASSLDR
jgi:hypothetical protein